MSHAPRRIAVAGLLLAAAVIAMGSFGPSGATVLAPVADASAAASGATVTLRMTANDGKGHRSSARLSCRGDAATGSGYVRAHPVSACRTARRIAAFLAARPPARMCTQVYGGPQTARIRGTIGSRKIDRSFDRRDGCGISDWSRAGLLLPRP
jgi:hypothetical protein